MNYSNYVHSSFLTTFCAIFLSFTTLSAQNQNTSVFRHGYIPAATNDHSKQHDHEEESIYGDSLAGFSLDSVMHLAIQGHYTPGEITYFINRSKRDYIDQRYNLKASRDAGQNNQSFFQNARVVMPPCTNLDFETGDSTGWSAFFGLNSNSNQALGSITSGFFSPINSPLANATTQTPNHRITIMDAFAGNDPCGGFPVVAPALAAGGFYSLRLGNNVPNQQGEYVEQTFTVSTTTSNFTYQYAVVFEDPGHSPNEQPYFKTEMFDQNGNSIACGYYFVRASPNDPNFFNCGPVFAPVRYRPWTTVSVDLAAYVGQNVTIRFTVAGCTLGGHYGYAYVEASCIPYVIANGLGGLCPGGQATITAPPGAAQYVWQPTGDTTASIVVNTPGTYTVTMTSVANCLTNLSTTVIAYPLPQLSYTPTFVPCSLSYTFPNTSTIASGTATYQWDFGVPTTTLDTSTQYSPSWVYTNPGTYTVSLIGVSNFGCRDTLQTTVYPGNGGQANFSAPATCLNNPSIFTDQSTPATGWLWNFGEPSSGPADSSNLQNPTHTYSAPGTYTVTLTAQTSPCPSIIQQSITVSPLPLAQFSYTQVCGGQVANFVDSSTVQAPSAITGVSWNFGDPASGASNISTLNNPQHIFTSAGTYTVILTVTSTNNCQTTSSQQIVVAPSPVAQFTTTNVCQNTPMSFVNTSLNTSTYFWDFGETSITTDTTSATTPNYTYAAAGNYTVSLIASPNTICADTSTLQVTVDALPQVQFTAPGVCIGSASSFTDLTTVSNGTVAGWSWDFGETTITTDTSTVQNPIYTYTSPGTYTVSLTSVSAAGCPFTASQQVDVYAQPAANFTAPGVCANTPMNFTDLSTSLSGTVTNWSWDFGDGSPIVTGQQNPTHTYTTVGTWQPILIVTTSNGCQDTITIQTITAAPPTPLFVADTLFGCLPLCVQFTDQSTISIGTINSWVWDFGDGSPLNNLQNPQYCYPASGSYNVTLTAGSGTGCTSTLTLNNYINVYPKPIAQFVATPPITSVVNTMVLFTDQSQGTPTTWDWDFGDPSSLTDVATTPTADYTYSNEYGATYPVTLIVTNQYGCADTVTQDVIVEPEFKFYIPNAFTPNGDGRNDTFFGQGIGIGQYEIWVFDRWGNLVFNTRNINEGWNGVMESRGDEICQQDVYVWRVNIVDVFGEKHKYIGHVSLIR